MEIELDTSLTNKPNSLLNTSDPKWCQWENFNLKKKCVYLHFLTCGLKNPPPASFGAVSASVNILDWKLEGAGRSFQSDVYSSRLLLSAEHTAGIPHPFSLKFPWWIKTLGLPSWPCLDNSAPCSCNQKKKKIKKMLKQLISATSGGLQCGKIQVVL